MRIHKEGHKIILINLLVILLINAAVFCFLPCSILSYIVLAISIVVFCVILNFFKSPHCVFNDDKKDVVIAPADGRIVVIEEVFEPDYFQDKRLQVSVFMSVFNVHVNWIPVDGKVVHYSYQEGRYMAAYLPKSSSENERSTVVIRRENGDEILVRQIAGAMAKRIVTYAEEGQDCHINQQLGFIKFGSRVDLFLPLDADIKVDMEQKVYGNQTIIAKLK
ncbi:phosphatidylserine decarboxylase [Dysgonomonadaceae bacterium PH5-43]|nr:phosphatidylserine decarboxylase [Dysgonomonadaceae bacterium PH5-43]